MDKCNIKTGLCETRPLIPYFGGKQRVTDKIISKFPKHDTFLEPFTGGGSVYWKHTGAKKYIINDLNKDIYNLYKTAKNSPQIVKKCDLNTSRGEFNTIKQKPKKSACDTMKLCKNSFGSNCNSYAERNRNYHNHFNKNNEKKLEKTSIFNEDFRRIAKRYDRKGVVQYWDPPYPGHGHEDTYITRGVKPKEVCDTAKSMKRADVVLSYSIDKEVRKACKGLNFSRIKIPYSAKARYGRDREKYEYLITNFKPRKNGKT